MKGTILHVKVACGFLIDNACDAPSKPSHVACCLREVRNKHQCSFGNDTVFVIPSSWRLQFSSSAYSVRRMCARNTVRNFDGAGSRLACERSFGPSNVTIRTATIARRLFSTPCKFYCGSAERICLPCLTVACVLRPVGSRADRTIAPPRLDRCSDNNTKTRSTCQ